MQMSQIRPRMLVDFKCQTINQVSGNCVCPTGPMEILKVFTETGDMSDYNHPFKMIFLGVDTYGVKFCFTDIDNSMLEHNFDILPNNDTARELFGEVQ